jgi:hypothetical protein
MPPSFHPYAEKPMDTEMEGWKEPSKRPFTPIIHTLHSLPPHSPLSKQAKEGWKEGGRSPSTPLCPYSWAFQKCGGRMEGVFYFIMEEG